MKFFNDIHFYISYDSLCPRMLPHFLFKRLFYIRLRGVVASIDAQTFKDFDDLKKVDIQVDNLEELLHSGTEWMLNLNEKILVNLNKSSNLDLTYMALIRFYYPKGVVSFNRIYRYSNEDFCLFKDFPHTHLVYALILPGEKLECTCTLLWLQLYTRIYADSEKINIINDYSLNYENQIVSFMFCGSDFLGIYEKCEFEKRRKICDESKNKSSYEKRDMNDTDVFFLVKWLQFILLTLLQPILCVFG
jgi:hypothetical protein